MYFFGLLSTVNVSYSRCDFYEVILPRELNSKVRVMDSSYNPLGFFLSVRVHTWHILELGDEAGWKLTLMLVIMKEINEPE